RRKPELPPPGRVVLGDRPLVQDVESDAFPRIAFLLSRCSIALPLIGRGAPTRELRWRIGFRLVFSMSDSPASEPPGEGAPPPLVPSLPQPHLPRPGEAVATYGPQGSAVDTGKEKAKAGGWSPGSRPPLREKRGCGCGAVLAALV